MERIFAGKTFLLVDDRPENLFSLEALLEPSGAALLVAFSGNEALKILYRNQAIDGVLMDVQMPQMSGFEAAALLQHLPATAAIPVIFITAEEGRTTADAAFAQVLPHPVFLYKPITAQSLEETLKRVLQEKA